MKKVNLVLLGLLYAAVIILCLYYLGSNHKGVSPVSNEVEVKKDEVPRKTGWH